jgi:hypothetical protein
MNEVARLPRCRVVRPHGDFLGGELEIDGMALRTADGRSR